MNSIPAIGAKGAAAPADDARLRKAAKQLDGVLVGQLFKAMRDTVPHDGMTDGGAGEDMFSGLLDQRLSETAAAKSKHGMNEGLVRQLLPHLHAAATSTGAGAAGVVPGPGLTRTR